MLYVVGYLGVCRAVWRDNINNILVVVTPWSIIQQCVEKNIKKLASLDDTIKKIPHISIINLNF